VTGNEEKMDVERPASFRNPDQSYTPEVDR
jgi:hypothetical protein